jgi:hypothetical protein
MGFEFTQRRGIEGQVRSIARDQIDKALQECGQDSADFGKLVHGLRRRCKKLRGLVRLIEPHFKHWRRENRVFRDAADMLSGSRDAAVLVETLAHLLAFDARRESGVRIDAGQGEELRQWLEGRIGQPPTGADRADLLAEFVALFESAGRRAKGWSLSGRKFDRIGDGLEATYRRMREGLASAEATQTAEALHAWRKGCKYHWHHVSLLLPTAPDLLRPRRAAVDRLAEMLGDHHNLAVLDETLAPREGVAAVREVIAERQALLAFDAFELGRQLTAEKPGMLRDRFEQYWPLLPART